ncbi:RagB/SusD family nutrient uptake outer membrane protein [Chryseobacterium viscerum]|uniref:RagB/SusD family nutrient uptake outer membrane protein n=1 Tax=Chryseobacterium viscerum TaxID=1037377 RepID=UPI001EE85C7E|nr:RagB/SusD family nutrient uptake outer membrane protein [Chryseobacterium viscerum]
MRAAEMYLIEAEAINGNVSQAVAVLNQLKSARNVNIYNGSLAQNNVIATVLIERRKELFGEGFSLQILSERREQW